MRQTLDNGFSRDVHSSAFLGERRFFVGNFLSNDVRWTDWFLAAMVINPLLGFIINRGLGLVFPAFRVKPRKPRFNDDVYCTTIEEFEDEVVPARVKTEQIG